MFLPHISLSISHKTLDKNGIDVIEFSLVNATLKQISSGEFNRLRLGLFALKAKYNLSHNSILFLDEIDANLSGKESESVANILKYLSQFYQIFVISHQPHICAITNNHFLVYKQNGQSLIKKLNKTEQVQEIARMVSGKEIKQEAYEFAKKLLEV